MQGGGSARGVRDVPAVAAFAQEVPTMAVRDPQGDLAGAEVHPLGVGRHRDPRAVLRCVAHPFWRVVDAQVFGGEVEEEFALHGVGRFWIIQLKFDHQVPVLCLIHHGSRHVSVGHAVIQHGPRAQRQAGDEGEGQRHPRSGHVGGHNREREGFVRGILDFVKACVDVLSILDEQVDFCGFGR